MISCRGKKESIYAWKGEEESRELTLLRNNTFILEIKTDYYSRIDTGSFKIIGDTLIINPDKGGDAIDSVFYVDAMLNERRYVEVNEEEIVFDTNNVEVESFYRATLFPSVTINDSLALSVSPDDSSFRKLIIPDSVSIHKLTINVQEGNTCRPGINYHFDIPPGNEFNKSFLVFIPSRRNRENYLAGFKWLIRGDTIVSFFANNNCDPVGIKLVRQQ
jgi:hypothetical protein